MEKEQALEIYMKAKPDVKKRVEENENGSNFFFCVQLCTDLKTYLADFVFNFVCVLSFQTKKVSVLKSFFKLNYFIVYLVYVVCVSLV